MNDLDGDLRFDHFNTIVKCNGQVDMFLTSGSNWMGNMIDDSKIDAMDTLNNTGTSLVDRIMEAWNKHRILLCLCLVTTL